ncbi:hypothetical protein C8A00DRAFT_12467 [Chaetomidium leptoderma]|uniref:Uncharacterized protein n=1 Tax=Chaetomidium leptoderma TaxID=669021 RepID=A0AAN7A080_9PEZI|nr:hypothetical protein C8A00DRAFT_12467 [Chaetomidium leptoderma]
MPALTTMVGRSHRRFPGLRIRPARSYDFRRMACMANEIFQHERDIDHFNKHHCVKMGYEAEASAADRLLAAERDWRVDNMRRSQRKPGRQFIVATYMKEPAEFLMRRHGSGPREELLGWAEWQDPVSMSDEPARNGGPSDSYQSEAGKLGGQKVKAGSALDEQLESVLKSLTFVHESQPLLVPPNGLAVRLPDALESFRHVRANDPEGWKRWHKQIIPACFGETGDTQGRHLGKCFTLSFHGSASHHG